MKLGFTGSQNGITEAQFARVKKLVIKIEPDEIHHGDCIGADATFHIIVTQIETELGLRIKKIGHIPIKNDKRAFCQFDETRPAREYLLRNRNIVDEVDIMIGCPSGVEEIIRSGTWSTLRYTKKANKTHFIVFPDGTWDCYKRTGEIYGSNKFNNHDSK